MLSEFMHLVVLSRITDTCVNSQVPPQKKRANDIREVEFREFKIREGAKVNHDL